MLRFAPATWIVAIRPIPIWLGGSGPKAFDRAARHVGGLIFFGAGGIDSAVEAWASMQKPLIELGRPPHDFGAEYVTLSQGADNLAAECDIWRAAGGTHFAIATMGFGLDQSMRITACFDGKDSHVCR